MIALPGIRPQVSVARWAMLHRLSEEGLSLFMTHTMSEVRQRFPWNFTREAKSIVVGIQQSFEVEKIKK